MVSKIVLSVQKISKSYWTSFKGNSLIRVVDNLSFNLSQGEVYGLIGPNGAGKTTTVKMIVGLTSFDKGDIKIFDSPVDNIIVHHKIGFMPENPSFYAHLTAREFLRFVAKLFQVDQSQREKKIEQLLDSVGLTQAANRSIGGFSKGMRQRLGLAQSLINDPQLIILDEPLDGLDPLGRSDIKEQLLEMKKEGKTILLSSHILSDVEEICDRIGIIDKGKLIEEGPVKELIPKNKTLEEYFVQMIKTASR